MTFLYEKFDRLCLLIFRREERNTVNCSLLIHIKHQKQMLVWTDKFQVIFAATIVKLPYLHANSKHLVDPNLA